MSILNKISGLFGAKDEEEGATGDVTGGDTTDQPTTEPAPAGDTGDDVVDTPTEETTPVEEATPAPEITPEPDAVIPKAPEGESEGEETKPTEGMAL